MHIQDKTSSIRQIEASEIEDFSKHEGDYSLSKFVVKIKQKSEAADGRSQSKKSDRNRSNSTRANVFKNKRKTAGPENHMRMNIEENLEKITAKNAEQSVITTAKTTLVSDNRYTGTQNASQITDGSK